MKSGPKTIKDLFSGAKIFRVPEYQRPYAWEKQQFQEFLEDISHNLKRNHFFGTILFQVKPSLSENFRYIDIVDGQQRITTLTIFIKLLLEKLPESNDNLYESLVKTYIQSDGEYKLNVSPVDDDYFKSRILKNDLSAANRAETPSQKRLLEAKKWFQIWIDNWFKKEPFESLQQLILNIENMRVLTYSVEDRTEAALIFETTNDRGKPMTNLDKVKSILMYNGALASDSPENRESFLETLQNRFGKIYHNIDEIGSQVSEDSILQYHCIAFEKWSSAKDYRHPVRMIKQIINERINEGNRQEAKDFINNHSLNLQESFADIQTLLLRKDSYVNDILAIDRPAVAYHLLIKTYRMDISNKKQNFERVARLMEIICFRFGIEKYKVDKGQGTLYKLSRDFTGDFELLIKNLKKFVDDFCDRARFRQHLSSSTFYKIIKSNDRLYLFWKYENHLREKEKLAFYRMSYDEFTNKDPRTKLSIDHISPQNPKNSQGSEFKRYYLHSIGNLVLDSISANSSKSNSDDFNFNYKEYYSKSTLRQQMELKDFCAEQTEKLIWNKSAIKTRKEKILKFAVDYWNHKEV